MALHELRAPLGLVANAARSAADDCADDYLRGRCETIVRAAERMLRTAQQVLSLAKSADDQGGIETFNAAAVARTVAEDFAGMGVAVCVVAEWDREPLFTGVRGHLETLLSSLISNALDHGDAGGEVSVVIVGGQKALTIEIRNHKRAVGRHAGLGLGTYICDQLAALLPAVIQRTTDGDSYSVHVELAVATAPELRARALVPA
jgi:signal transduction histidine kinase